MRGAKFFGKHDVRVADYPVPDLGARDVLVKVKASGVCGTDIHVYEDEVPLANLPVIPGHEFAGVVEEVGSGVADVSVGDRVAVEPNLFCGECHFCRTKKKHFCENWQAVGLSVDGGFAEFARVPRQAVYQIPTDLSFEEAAFFEPVACVLHGIERTHLQPGDTVALVGAGSIGLLFTQLLRVVGAGKVIVADLDARKLSLAADLGADVVVNSSQEDLRTRVLEETGSRGADVVIDAAGVPQLTLGLVKTTGTILFFGVPPENYQMSLKPFDIYRRELTIVGSFTNPYTNEAALRLIPRINVGRLVTHRVTDLGDLEGAIVGLRDKAPGMIKVQVQF
ncbi:MAG: zinc-dependent alcohol dehydrogenase family protein [Promethearchaeota archaeon]